MTDAIEVDPLMPSVEEFAAGLPREWCRGPQWRSEDAKRTWGPVLEAAQRAWEMTELASVSAGLRSSALVYLTVEEFVRASADCAANGLELTPVEAAGPLTIRAAVHKPGLAHLWRRAWAEGNDDAIGQLLGFPACCREFFLREWKEGGRADVTPAMRTVEGPWTANILLRWLGVRLVPHLPCSGDCEETLRQADLYYAAGAAAGADVEAIAKLLYLPVRYSQLAGVGVVETEHFRFMFGAGQGKVERERAAALFHGDVPRLGSDAGDTAADNGFSSDSAMEAAHRVVVEAVTSRPYNSAVDLGCGDGNLLLRLRNIAGGTDPAKGPWIGVEVDAGRVARGWRRWPSLDLRHGKIQDTDIWSGPTDLALLMPGRLLEMSREEQQRVLAALRLRAKRVVLYAYSDQLARYGGIVPLALQAGLGTEGSVFTGSGVQAVEGRVK